MVRHRIVLTGVVQGVGFRPHVARLAARHALAGWCRNTSMAVVVEAEGPEAAVRAFTHALTNEAPRLARIVGCEVAVRRPEGGTGFVIVPSEPEATGRTLIPPDVATCPDCLRELTDPADRRYRHPFITCTNCGPRLTIITDVPYDRPATSMADFPMCPACAAEYGDPADRRFHAQPIACPDCGPSLRLLDPDGRLRDTGRDAPSTGRILAQVTSALAAGRIVAIKGIGGFHLAVDATNESAVRRLRARKRRPHQPFALMARDEATAAAIVELCAAGRALLGDPARPIVVLPTASTPGSVPTGAVSAAVAPVIAPSVAPGLGELGVMLPYAPVHHLLLDGAIPVLVMTSANPSGEPLVSAESEAIRRLGNIADVILSHDRDIVVPCEDSVWMLDGDDPLPVRRSRGYAPLPVPLVAHAPPTGAAAELNPSAPAPTVLAAGAEIKNTVGLTRDGWAFISAHVGDLATLAGRRQHEATAAALVAFHRSPPQVVAADAHPGYASRSWAQAAAQAYGVPLVTVQHHHAHLAALAAEHGLIGAGPVLGIVADGTGYGCDETIWGGELLLLTDGGARFERLGMLRPWPLPGGDAGVRHPGRQAVAALAAAGLDPTATAPYARLGAAAPTIAALVGRPTGWVATSSAGRLFDVVAALLGVRQEVSYEAQAAIELEALARRADGAVPLPAPCVTAHQPDPDRPDAPGLLVADPRPLLAALAADPVASAAASTDAGGAEAARARWALAFHDWLAAAFVAMAEPAARRYGVRAVALTGGCFQNRLLLAATRRRLAESGLGALTHRVVPPNDGGLALGQCAVAAVGISLARRPTAAATPDRTGCGTDPAGDVPAPAGPADTEGR